MFNLAGNRLKHRLALLALLAALPLAARALPPLVPDPKGVVQSGAQKAAQKGVEKAADAVLNAKEAPPPGAIKFIGKNLTATANGTFKKWKLTKVQIDRQNSEKSVVELEIDLDSLDTGIKKRDDHLRTPDFFDVKQYPKATLKVHDAKPANKKASGHPVYAGKMDVDLHGVKKTLDVEFELVRESPMEVAGKLTLLRSDFSVGAPHSKANPLSPQDEIALTYTAKLPDKL